MQRRASDQIDLTKVVDGKDGTSVTILGSYNTMSELETAHPTGSRGDAYMVGGDLVIWNGTSWENVGRIQGPQGDPGTPGAPGTGVASVQPQYYLSTSDQAATGGTWGNTITFVSGLYIWSRDEVTYSNGSVDHSAEVYNQALTIACENAISALAAAQAVNQYTWHTETDTGAGAGTHITMIPQDEFLADPANGGFNVLINSLGTFIRDGLTVTAFYGATNRVGESNNARVEVSSTEINAYDQNGATAFSVQSDGAASTKDISVRKTIEAFSALRNDTATYTLPNTPIANSQVVVLFYAGGEKYSFSYLYGTTGQHIESSVGITFNYSGNTITAIATQYAIAWAAVTYKTRTTNALVDIPAELHIQTENFTDFLFDPKLSSDSLLDYGSRTQDIYGGYATIGKWVFVDVGFDVDVGMSANNFWRVIDGFPVPAGGQSVLTVLFWDESDADSGGNRKPKVLGGYVNSSGRLIIVTQGTALAYDDTVSATGWYIAQ